MPSIEQVRRFLARTIRDDGVVQDMDLSKMKKHPVTVGEVVSLVPPRVELLNGEVVTVKAKAAGMAAPQVGDIVLLNRIGPVLIVVDTVEVI